MKNPFIRSLIAMGLVVSSQLCGSNVKSLIGRSQNSLQSNFSSSVRQQMPDTNSPAVQLGQVDEPSADPYEVLQRPPYPNPNDPNPPAAQSAFNRPPYPNPNDPNPPAASRFYPIGDDGPNWPDPPAL